MKEVLDSVTGFDEIAVKQKFGAPLSELMKSDGLQGARALIFVMEKHDGKSDPEAFHVCQSLRVADVNDRFSTEDSAEGVASDFVEPPHTTMP